MLRIELGKVTGRKGRQLGRGDKEASEEGESSFSCI